MKRHQNSPGRGRAKQPFFRRLGLLGPADRGRRVRRGRLEYLEERRLLAFGALASAPLGSVAAEIADPGTTQEVLLTVDSGDAPVVLGLSVRAADGSGLDPRLPAVLDGDGVVVPGQVSLADLNGSADSLLLAELGTGQYAVTLGAEGGSTGEFFFDVFLPGDMDGDGRVDEHEFQTGVAAVVKTIGSDSPVTALLFRSLNVDFGSNLAHSSLDANRDGLIDAADLGPIQANMQANSTVQIELSADDKPPAISATLENDTGRSAADNITSDPVVLGTVDDRSAVSALDAQLDGGAVAGILDLLVDGSFRLDTDRLNDLAGGELADGQHTLTFTARDELDNASEPFEFVFNLDTAAPDPPAPLDLVTASDTGERNDDDVTADDTPSFATDAEENALVEVFLVVAEGEDLLVGSGVVNSPVTIDTIEPAADGAQTFFATATDVAGNTSAPSDPLTITFDTEAPALGSVDLAPESDTGTAGDKTTSATTVTLRGSTEPGAAVDLADGTVRSTVADGAGNFQFTDVALDFGANPFTVVVADAAGNTSAPTVVTFTRNNPPTFGPDIDGVTATEDQSFTLDVSDRFEDADIPGTADVLEFKAELQGGAELPTWLTLDDATGVLSGIPTNADVGDLLIVVTATDSVGANTSSNALALAVANVNDAPAVVFGIDDQTADEDAPFDLDVAGRFGDDDLVHGDALSLSATLAGGGDLPAWLTFTPSTARFTGTPDNADVGSIQIELTATDSAAATAAIVFGLEVRNTNDAPVVDAPIGAQTVDQDAAFDLDVSGRFGDDDLLHGDTLSLSATLAGGGDLPQWLIFNPGTVRFTGIPGNVDVGTIQVEVTATDNQGASVSATFDLEVKNVNDAPAIADQGFNVEPGSGQGTVVGTVVASDQDAGDSLSFAITAGDADGVFAIDANTGEITVVKDGFLGNGTGPFELTVTVTDSGTPELSSEAVVTIEVAANTDPFVDDGIGDQTVAEDQPLDFTFLETAFDDAEDGTNLTYTAALSGGDALPSWLDFDAASRRFTGTPTNADVGTLTVRVTAADRFGATVADEFDLEVTNTNDAPQVASAVGDQEVDEDAEIDLQVSGNFADDDLIHGDQLAFSATLAGGGALPTWLKFDSATGKFSGMPLNGDVGTIQIAVTATDLAAATASTSFQLEVLNTNDAPFVAQTIGQQAAAEGTDLALDISGNFGDDDLIHDDQLTFSAALVGGGALPSWLTLNPDTGQFSGIPGNADVGTVQIAVTAADTHGADVSTEFTLVVSKANQAPQVSTEIDDKTATSSENFEADIADSFFDPDSDPLTFSAKQANDEDLPSWLSISATGELSGTPTLSDVGTLLITVTATDPFGAAADDTFQLEVLEVNVAPTVLADVFHVASGSAKGAAVGTVAASDPNAGDSLTYSITAGDPAGLFAIDANGAITVNANGGLQSGVAAVNSLFTLTVRVTDSGTPVGADTATVSVVVDPAAGAAIVELSLEVTDKDGNPLPVVDGVAVVSAGEQFLLNGFVQDVRGFGTPGVFSAYQDVFYDNAALISVIVGETQTLTLADNTTGGTYTLTFDGQNTGPIDLGGGVSQAIANLQTALEALPSIGPGNVEVTHTPITDSKDQIINPFVFAIRFVGTLAQQDVANMTADGSGLSRADASPGVANIAETLPADPANPETFTSSFRFVDPYVNGHKAADEPAEAGRPATERQFDEVGAFAGQIGAGGDRSPLFHVILNAVAAGRVVFVGNPAEDGANKVLVFGSDDVVPTEQVQYGSVVIDIVPAAVGTTAASAAAAADGGPALVTLGMSEPAVVAAGDAAASAATGLATDPVHAAALAAVAAGGDSAASGTAIAGGAADSSPLEPVLGEIAADVASALELGLTPDRPAA